MVRGTLAKGEISVFATAPATLAHGEAVRFLQRATFGGSPSEVASLIAEGVENWWEREVAEMPGRSNFALFLRDGVRAPTLWNRYFTGNALLRKRLGYALSQIFVTSFDGADGFAVAEYVDLLEKNCFGTYRELLEVISKSVAMGQYLTYTYNFKADWVTGQLPDENYAREILQLFSIGLVELNLDGTVRHDSAGNPIETYGQDDILGLARVFTGWYPDTSIERPARMRRPMVNNPQWHSPESKSFLGTTIPANTGAERSMQIALDTIANHPNVAPFISRQLIQRLVTSNPSPAYVRRIASVFTNDGNGVRGNLEAVFWAILTDDEAWSPPTSTTGKLREPVLRFTTVMRALDVRSTERPWKVWSTKNPAESLGHSPFESLSVFNFYRPGYTPPTSRFADRGLVAPEFQIANETSVFGWVNFIARFLQWPPAGIEFNYTGLLVLADRPPGLVNELASRLVGWPLSPDTHQTIVNAVSAINLWTPEVTRMERIHGAVVMIAASNDFLYDR